MLRDRMARVFGFFPSILYISPLRHTFCDSLVAYVWFLHSIAFPHTVFYFFKWKMKIGWHFIWHLSDSRDVLETSKTIFGGRGSAEWMRLASLSFSQVSFLLLLFAHLRPWFLHRSLGSRICFSLIKTVQRKGSLKISVLNFLLQSKIQAV